jgi:hypothetical protein
MTVDGRPVQFTPALPGQTRPDIRAIGGGRPVFRAELPDGRIAWLVSGYENVRQVIVDQRFSRALAVAHGNAQPGFEMFGAGSINGMDPPDHTAHGRDPVPLSRAAGRRAIARSPGVLVPARVEVRTGRWGRWC